MNGNDNFFMVKYFDKMMESIDAKQSSMLELIKNINEDKNKIIKKLDNQEKLLKEILKKIENIDNSDDNDDDNSNNNETDESTNSSSMKSADSINDLVSSEDSLPINVISKKVLSKKNKKNKSKDKDVYDVLVKSVLSFVASNNNVNDLENDTNNDVNYDEPIHVDISHHISPKKFIEINHDINSVDDLLTLISSFANDNKKQMKCIYNSKTKLYSYNNKLYSISIDKLINLQQPLKKLNRLIGMNDIKTSVIKFITHFLQNHENNNMLHTIIEGPPGMGKTELARILCEIYSALGIVSSNKLKTAKATDLKGEFLGHTAQKTRKLLEESLDCVLLIDEAYSIGSDEKNTFAKECIDTINQFLTENKKRIVVIIAGYAYELEKHFFAYNPGLKSRFPFKYTINDYSIDELKNIFIIKLRQNHIKLAKSINDQYLLGLFKDNLQLFENYGRDIENFVLLCKFENTKRLFGKDPYYNGILIDDDINNAIADKKKSIKIKDKAYLSMFT